MVVWDGDLSNVLEAVTVNDIDIPVALSAISVDEEVHRLVHCSLYSRFLTSVSTSVVLCCCICTLGASLCLFLRSICAHIAPLCRVLLSELEQDKSNGSIGTTSVLFTNWGRIGLQQCRSRGLSKVLLPSSKRRPVSHIIAHNCT